MNTKSLIAGLLLLSLQPAAAQVYGEQPTYPGRDGYGALRFHQTSAWYSYLMLGQHRRDAVRAEEFARACRSAKAMRTYQDSLRQRFARVIGPLPERGELHAQTTGVCRGDGFRVEKIVYQSTPHRYVTAHLYLPEPAATASAAPRRWPACVEMCGHGQRGKGDCSQTALDMVRAGVAVIVVDPIGQGERLQITGPDLKPLTRGVTTEHTLLAPPYALTGTSLPAQIAYDNSRAIDYLVSRDDIDPTRIGAYGFSGGGTETAYLAALDRRVSCACVGLFFSSRTRTLEIQGPSDGCQQAPFEGREGIEIADMAMINAPAHFLVLDGRFDFVDHWGALTAFDELQRCYTALGYPGRVRQYYAEDGHATPDDVRRELVHWFTGAWAIPSAASAPSAAAAPWRAAEPLCTAAGQVNAEWPDARSTMAETLAAMDSLAPSRQRFLAQDTAAIRRRILDLLGVDSLPAGATAFPTGQSRLRDSREYRYQVNATGAGEQMPVAVVLRVPDTATDSSPVEIHLCDRGKAWYLTDLGGRDEASDGRILLAADFRGFGELEDPYIYNYSKYWNREYRCAATALHQGRPLLGQRVIDLAALLRFCAFCPETKGRRVSIVADGLYGPVVMHAGALGLPFASAVLTRTLKTWRTYLENPLQRDMYSNTVPSALRYYDLPDLLRLAQGRVRVAD